MKISVIIPVYNNQDTLKHLLDVLISYPHFTEIISVNDGSSDNSRKILQNYPQIIVVDHQVNKGKGAAIVSGWKQARNNYLFTIDADLKNYSHKYINQIISAMNTEKCDMVIGARDRILPFGWVSGERAYFKNNVMAYMDLAVKSGNGVEQIINYAHIGKKVKLIIIKNTGHVLKYQRYVPHQAAWLYIKEGWQLIRTEHQLGYPVTNGIINKLKKIKFTV